ncbi:MAG: YlmH/Sll1252 family protein [Eubacteriales bacterium]|nr:YlmH/Sll1252 family protein [Eubacteriales bacterium]
MTREEEFFQKHLIDLANMADRRNIVTFTDFLGLNELNIFHSCEKELSFVKYRAFGGYENAERQMIAFLPDALSYEWDYPMKCIRISPLNRKYAEKLTHRDYLGAILNLGLERSAIGDILIEEDTAYVFCLETMADLLCRELTRIRHTSVNPVVTEVGELTYRPKSEIIRGSVASVRLDSLLALAFQSSRSKLTELVEGGRVYVNGRLVTSNGYKIKDQDMISARGLGRFRYLGNEQETRKKRLFVEIEKFI